jgi:hypothetical protein
MTPKNITIPLNLNINQTEPEPHHHWWWNNWCGSGSDSFKLLTRRHKSQAIFYTVSIFTRSYCFRKTFWFLWNVFIFAIVFVLWNVFVSGKVSFFKKFSNMLKSFCLHKRFIFEIYCMLKKRLHKIEFSL